MAAWRQKEENCILVVGKDEILDIPIPPDAKDELVLRRIRMFYRMLQMESSIVGVVFPRLLERIDCIEVRSFILDSLPNRMPGPHETSRLIQRLARSAAGNGHCSWVATMAGWPVSSKGQNLAEIQTSLLTEFHDMPQTTALSFKQSYNITVMSAVIVTPLVASIVFAIVWIRVHGHKEDVDLQALVTTAFTVAIYTVTSGKLIVRATDSLD